jgi:hypothetical protein
VHVSSLAAAEDWPELEDFAEDRPVTAYGRAS